MKKVLFTSAVLLGASLMFTSCEKEKDNEKPVIALEDPADGEVLFIGKGVHFEMNLSDNEGLKSYKVNMHDNMANPHTHSAARASASDSIYLSHTWMEDDFVKKGETPIADMKSKHIHHHHIVIPEKMDGKPVREGKYHFMVYCTDMNGNESYVSRNVILKYPKPGEAEDPHHDHNH